MNNGPVYSMALLCSKLLCICTYPMSYLYFSFNYYTKLMLYSWMMHKIFISISQPKRIPGCIKFYVIMMSCFIAEKNIPILFHNCIHNQISCVLTYISISYVIVIKVGFQFRPTEKYRK